MADKKKTLYLVRHGQTEGNITNRLAGSTDQPLTLVGRSQAEDLASWFAWRLGQDAKSAQDSTSLARPDLLCVSSPLFRARQTAQAAAARLGLSVQVDDDLAEMDFGDWEGRTVEDILAEDPKAFEQWASPDEYTCFPGGESQGAFEARVRRALQRILAREESGVLVFTHGGVVRAATCALLGLDREYMWRLRVEPATVVYFELYGEAALSGQAAILAGLWNVADFPAAVLAAKLPSDQQAAGGLAD